MKRAVAIVAAVALLGAVALYGIHIAQAATGTSSCTFQKSPTANDQAAFCDTFDQAAASNDSRSGALNPTVWGVSEIQAGGGDHYQYTGNTGDAVAPVVSQATNTTVYAPNNVQIENGQLFDSVNDDGGQTVLGMYPRQPFDIAGRTGDVSFDVSDNSQGDHAAWPALVYTDQPVPAPYSSASGILTTAQNSFGITFAQQCDQPSNKDCATQNACPETNDVSVDTMFTTNDFVLNSVGFTLDGCVAKSTSPTEQNHVEVLMSASSVQVWASNPGSSTLVELAHALLAMPLTRGLLWMDDVHYNGDKFNTQQSNTFSWDNFGFDGPVLPRDLGFDVPYADNVNSDGSVDLGWAGSSVTVKTRADDPVTAANIAAASGALVEFNWYAEQESVPGLTVNGHAIPAAAWPSGYTYVWRTIAIAVPLTDVVTGQNTITVTGVPGGVANFDLILQGAGGTPTCLDPSDCTDSTPTPSTTPSPSPSPTPSPTPSATPTPTPSASPTPTPSPTPTTYQCAVLQNGHLVAGTCTGFTPD